jgi:hypothetical protein
MEYRILKPHEKPDKAKGDEFVDFSWQTTSHAGTHTVKQIVNGEPGLIYRRPVKPARKTRTP